MRWVAWLPAVQLGEGKGALATIGQRLIVADSPEEIRTAFAGAAEPVPLRTVNVREWLAHNGVSPELLGLAAERGAR